MQLRVVSTPRQPGNVTTGGHNVKCHFFAFVELEGMASEVLLCGEKGAVRIQNRFERADRSLNLGNSWRQARDLKVDFKRDGV